MSQINVSNLTFYYEGSYDNIFEEVSFQIDTDWKLGFISRNGRGKTTFLNLLMGKYEYRGKITANTQFNYFPYVLSSEEKEKDTIEVIEMMEPDYELWKVMREFTFLDVDGDILYRSFSLLSNGEQTKVMLAVLFAKDDYFLLIDEPTNHLDAEARELVKEYLKTKKGFILVSHDRNFLDACIDHVLIINKTNIEVRQGNFTSWWEDKARQDEYEQAENERLKKDIKRLSAAAKRTGGWSDQIEKSKIGEHVGDRGFVGHKAAKMMKRAKATEQRAERAVEEKSGLLKNIETADSLKMNPLTYHKDILIRAEDFAIYYGERKITEDLTFTIKNGERIVLQGKNGCGKSSILKKIMGEEIASTGLLEIAGGLVISYVSQDTSSLSGTLEDFVEMFALNETLFLTVLRKLDLERIQFEKRIEEYSGGQKKKVLLAKSLCEQAHLYVWDEPLNYIDVFSRIQIEDVIREFAPTMILVEHDKVFGEKIATQMVIL